METPNEETLNPLLKLKFDTVCMYDYEPAAIWDNLLIVNKATSLVADEHVKKVVELDNTIVLELIHLLGDSKSYGDDIMRCFIPHLGFVFFLDNKIVFHVSICLTCNNMRPSIEIPAHTAGRGMTKAFRGFFNNLLDKHDFSNNIVWE